MNTVLTNVSRVARKRYRCWFCNQRIDLGEKHGYRTGADEEGIWTMRFHPECGDYAHEHWDYDDWECHEAGEFERPMTAFCPEI